MNNVLSAGSLQFVTNNERMLVEYENALVLVTDMKIEAVKDIIPVLEQVGAHSLLSLLAWRHR